MITSVKLCIFSGTPFKVGTSTYISTTFKQLAEMKKFNRGLVADMFWGTNENMKGLQSKTSLSIAVICCCCFKTCDRRNMCYTPGSYNSFIMGLKGSPQIRFFSPFKSVFEDFNVNWIILLLLTNTSSETYKGKGF